MSLRKWLFFKKVNFWLSWAFVALFGLAAVSGGFSCGAQALGPWVSVVLSLGLQSTGSAVAVHRLSCSMACGVFLDQGLNVSPALAGRFLSTAPSGKSRRGFLICADVFWSKIVRESKFTLKLSLSRILRSHPK